MISTIMISVVIGFALGFYRYGEISSDTMFLVVIIGYSGIAISCSINKNKG